MRNRHRLFAAFIAVLLLLFSSVSALGESPAPAKYSGSFFGAFDTIIQLIGFTESEAAFRAVLEKTEAEMLRYHRIFDGYNAYEGVNNLYYVNHNAANGPVKAEPELIELLSFAKERQQYLNGTVNIAMGAVLSVWHEYRTAGLEVPPLELLTERAAHTDINDLVIDAEAGTVAFADPMLSIDLGAVAKGWTVERIAREILEKEMPSFILNAGGNVRCGEHPLDGRSFWGVGIQDPGDGISPAPSENIDALYLKELSVVTSGDYQRYYEVDGVRYHHIIDPQTLMPAKGIRSVSVITADSGEADMLSTALFLLPYEEGRALVDSLEGTEAFWILADRTACYTDGMKAMLLSEGASPNRA